MVNKNFVFITLAFLYLLSACNSSKTVNYTPIYTLNTPLHIDGLLDDNQEVNKSKLSGVDYIVSSTEQYLYIAVKVSDSNLQNKVFRFGMGVWVDTTGKQKNLMGIQFPLKLSDEQQNILQKQNQSLEKAYIDLANEFEMVGFAPEPLKATNTSSQHFKAALGFNELGHIICEYQIPWKAIHQNRALHNIEQIAIKIQINEQDITDTESQSDSNPLGNSITQGQNNMYNNNGTNMSRNPYSNPMSGTRQVPQMNKTVDYSTWIKLQINKS